MATKKIDVAGLSIKDIQKLSARDLRGLSLANVKQITSRLVSAMNKRIARLGKSEIGRLSPTYQAFKRHGKYSVKGLTRESTIQVFNRLKISLSKGTSLSSFKKQRKDLYKKLNIDFNDDLESERKFWESFHKYEEYDKGFQNYRKGHSNDFISYMKNDIDWENMTMEEKKQAMDLKYEELESKEKDYKTESTFFEDGGNGMDKIKRTKKIKNRYNRKRKGK